MNIAIIGAGASALYFSAFNKNDNITIFEKNKKIASKLLASGNGKCNLLNINASSKDYNNEKFMEKLFKAVSPSFILNEFNKLGLVTKSDDEGRVYPISESSQTVLDILMKNINANIILEHTVNKIEKVGNKYKVDDHNALFDKVILASGSKASVIKAKEDCYNYLKSFDLSLTSLKPSLCGFKTKPLKEISGVRVKCDVKLYSKGNLISNEMGEVIFKDDGISGIVIMNMSSYLNKIESQNPYIEIDLIPGYEPADMQGALNPLLFQYIKKYNINPHAFRLDINGVYDFQNAQVVSGGVDLNQINEDMSLKADRNIYLMGEMLDIDGKCGGYNLLFAFASAEIIRRSLK